LDWDAFFFYLASINCSEDIVRLYMHWSFCLLAPMAELFTVFPLLMLSFINVVDPLYLFGEYKTNELLNELLVFPILMILLSGILDLTNSIANVSLLPGIIFLGTCKFIDTALLFFNMSASLSADSILDCLAF